MTCFRMIRYAASLIGLLLLLIPLMSSCSDRSADGVSKGIVAGTVYVENTAGTIPKVLVSIADREYTTVTNGEFEFVEIPRGEQLITAYKAGYEPFSRSINVAEFTEVEVRLQRVTGN